MGIMYYRGENGLVYEQEKVLDYMKEQERKYGVQVRWVRIKKNESSFDLRRGMIVGMG